MSLVSYAIPLIVVHSLLRKILDLPLTCNVRLFLYAGPKRVAM